MASKPLNSETIAFTEKKMDMTLDDIIKMSKNSTVKVKKQRASNKSQKFFNSGAAQGNSSKVRQYMDSRSSLRQGALAQRRSNFQGNQFPLAVELARKAAASPIRNRAFNRSKAVNRNKPRIAAPVIQRKVSGQQQKVKLVPKQRPHTMDSLFANMKEQRMKVLSQQNNVSGVGAQQNLQRGRGRFGY